MKVEVEYLKPIVDFIDIKTRNRIIFINKKMCNLILANKTIRGNSIDISKEYPNCFQIEKVILTIGNDETCSFNCLFLPHLRELEIHSELNESRFCELLLVLKDVDLQRLYLRSIGKIGDDKNLFHSFSCLTSLTEFECTKELPFAPQVFSSLSNLQKLSFVCERDISVLSSLTNLKDLKLSSSNEVTLISLINIINKLCLTSLDIHSLPSISSISSLNTFTSNTSLSHLVLPISVNMLSSLSSLTFLPKSCSFYVNSSNVLPTSLSLDVPITSHSPNFFFSFELPTPLSLVDSRLTDNQLLFLLRNNIVSSPITQLYLSNSPLLTPSLFESILFNSIQHLYLCNQQFSDISSFTALTSLKKLMFAKTSFPAHLVPLSSVEILSLQSVDLFSSFTSLSNFPKLNSLELFDIPSKCYLDVSLKKFTHISSLLIEPLSYERFSLQQVSSIHNLVLYDKQSKLQPHTFDFYLQSITSLSIHKFLSIRDFSFVTEAKSLYSLNITECPLLDPSSLNSLSSITTLKELRIRQKIKKESTPITHDYSFISSLKSIEKLQLAITTTHEFLFSAFACKQLTVVDFSLCVCNDKKPIDPILFIPALTCSRLKELLFPSGMQVKKGDLWNVIKNEFALKQISINQF